MRKIITIGIILLAGAWIMQECSSDKGGGTADITKEYMNAVNEKDFHTAHQILDNLYAFYLQSPNNKKTAQRFWKAADYIYKAELEWELPQQNPGYDKQLMATLDSFNPIGSEPVGDHVYELIEHNDKYEAFAEYREFAEEYDKLCIELIKVCLRNENVDVATSIMKSMKNCYFKRNVDNTYIYEIDTSYKEKAQALLADYQ